MELEGKKAVIIGASRGIGRAIARAFAREGASLVVTATKEENLHSILEDVEKYNIKAFPIAWDIKNVSEAESRTAECAELLGGIDICVCNAGVIDHARPLHITEEQFDSVVDVNYKGSYFVCQAMANYMIANGTGEVKGKIINMASETGFQPSLMPYGSSKWAVVGYTMGLARYVFKHGVVVSAIAPGPVTTDMMGWTPGKSNEFPSAFGRMADPEEVADLAVFLASKKGNRMAGRPVFINGGLNW